MDVRIRERIKKRQAELSMTNTAIAKTLDITPQAVGQVLSGDRGTVPKSLLDVLEVLGLELVCAPKGEE